MSNISSKRNNKIIEPITIMPVLLFLFLNLQNLMWVDTQTIHRPIKIKYNSAKIAHYS